MDSSYSRDDGQDPRVAIARGIGEIAARGLGRVMSAFAAVVVLFCFVMLLVETSFAPEEKGVAAMTALMHAILATAAHVSLNRKLWPAALIAGVLGLVSSVVLLMIIHDQVSEIYHLKTTADWLANMAGPSLFCLPPLFGGVAMLYLTWHWMRQPDGIAAIEDAYHPPGEQP